ncbi:MAG: hypothetical protein R2824_17320 [Saprospiraceae bacterium]|nr:hypothetical protein [Lewinella sp.]
MNRTLKYDLQTNLINEILSRFDNKQTAADALSEILSINREAGYRRIRNVTMLSPDEVQKICRHFGISLDRYIHSNVGNIVFNFHPFVEPVRNFENYIDQLLNQLRRALQLDGAAIYYASQEITPFQYFYFPELTAFKMYVYGLTAWNMDHLEEQKCSLTLFSPEVFEKARECTRLYAKLPSTDLWGWEILNHSLNQIEYLAETHRFDPPEMALTVCDQLEVLMMRQEKMAQTGKKYFRTPLDKEKYGDFHLYYNQLVHTNNTILLKSPTVRMLFTTFSNPNFLSTSDDHVCDYFENWFEKTIRRSTAISVHSEKYRSSFFNRLSRSIQHLKAKVILMLDSR